MRIAKESHDGGAFMDVITPCLLIPGSALIVNSKHRRITTMKSLVIYSSKHHMNTEKTAMAIAAELGAEVRKLAEVRQEDLDGPALVGFGSGINGFTVHPELSAFLKKVAPRKGQKAFVFSTCASNKDWTSKFRMLLAAKGFDVVGEFHCSGLWTPLFFKIRSGHPDKNDIESARSFARSLPR